MARLSPSPSPSGGSTSRRLSEFLDEQQEPFSLDLYLLEKGCSPVLLDDAAAAAASTCWPRSITPAMARRAACKKMRADGLVRFLLSMLLRGTEAAAAGKKRKEKLPPPAAIDWGAIAVDGLEQKPPGNFKNAAPSSPCSNRLYEAVQATEEEDDEELDEEEDDEEQLSPVSVLEQRPFEQAPPVYVQKAMVIFRELMEAAYTPATAPSSTLDQHTKDSTGSENFHHRRNDVSATAEAAPTTTDRTTTGGAAHWEEMLEAELAKVHGLVAAEMAGAGVGPGDVRPELRDIGGDVAAAVLEALTEEVAVELMGDGP